jgi:multiple sugar transport system substrate-binding protein
VTGHAFPLPGSRHRPAKNLKILQWSHFVPAYDTWFDGTFCKQWGQKHIGFAFVVAGL